MSSPNTIIFGQIRVHFVTRKYALDCLLFYREVEMDVQGLIAGKDLSYEKYIIMFAFSCVVSGLSTINFMSWYFSVAQSLNPILSLQLKVIVKTLQFFLFIQKVQVW